MSRPPDHLTEPDAHVSLEELASVAEGRPASEETILHLSRCRECMAAYADAVRYHAAWVARPEDFQAAPATDAGGVERRPSTVPIVALAGAAAAILAVAGLLTLGPWRSATRGDVPPAVQHLLVHASATGLVFPGAEAGAAARRPSYRAGSGAADEATVAIEALRESVERGDRSNDRLYALIAGLIATNRVDLASDYIAEARGRAPQDPRFLVLEAMVSARRGDGAGAEALLQRARELDPRDPTVALDLGIVVAGTRGLTDARPHLLETIARAPGSPLAQRARQVLAGGSSR